MSRSRGGPSAWRIAGRVFRHELRKLSGLRLGASTALILLFFLAAGYGGTKRFQEETRRAERLERNYRAELARTTVDGAVEIRHPAIKPPWRLTFAVEGGQEETPSAYLQALSPLVAPELSGNQPRETDRGPVGEQVDWLFTYRVILPFAGFLLGYDLVNGDRRPGTLKLALTYPAPRASILGGKLLALWTGLAIPVSIGAALSLAVAALGIPLTQGDLLRTLLLLGLGLLLAAHIALLALLISSRTDEPATSLGVLAWFWVIGVLVLPAIGGVLANLLLPIPTERENAQALAAVETEVRVEFGGREGRWRGADFAALDDFALERVSARAEIRRANLQDRHRADLLERKLRQARRARLFATSSPLELVNEVAERLLGTGLGRDRRFINQARAFRGDLARALRSQDAADRRSPHLLFFSGYLSGRPLDVAALPRFAFRESSLGEGLRNAALLFSILAGETLVLAALTFAAFERLDVARTR